MDEIRANGSVCTYQPGISLHSLGSATSEIVGRFGRQDDRVMAPTHNLHSSLTDSVRSNGYSSAKSASTTLQSVLRGEVPAAYSHLTSRKLVPQSCSSHAGYQRAQCSPGAMVNGPSPERFVPSPHMNPSPQPRSPESLSHQGGGAQSPPFSEQAISSPYREARSPYPEARSPYTEPRSPYADVHSPYTDSRSSYTESRSPYNDVRSPYNSDPRSPYIAPRSPYHDPRSYEEVYPPSPVENSQEEPMDLSRKLENGSVSPANCYDSSNCSTDSVSNPASDGSLLRNLLNVGKRVQGRHNLGAASPETVRHFETFITGATRVTLAKKNMYPVTSRVSDWLLKIVQFASSIPEFATLSQNDKMTLILNSWARLLLLFMAEDDFEFAVTPLTTSCQRPETAQSPSPDEPTMKSVEGIQSFIKKCNNTNLDPQEYSFLRMAVLFNAGYVGLERPDVIDRLNSLVQQLLQEHVQAVRPDDVMHYSRLLLCLPVLYGVNCKMIENLFCQHINANMDMEVLLKEMLQNL